MIFQVNFSPSVTERSSPSVDDADALGLETVVEVRDRGQVAATPPVLWQSWQVVVASMDSWKVAPEAAKSQLSIDPWQLRQPAPVTGIALTFASAPLLAVWQTLQLVM